MSIFKEIQPMLDDLTLIHLKIKQMEKKGIGGDPLAELKRLYDNQKDELVEWLVSKNAIAFKFLKFLKFQSLNK